MIYLYSGTPGSGKSYHAIKDIKRMIQRGKPVISNLAIDYKAIKGKNKGAYYYVKNDNLTPEKLLLFARSKLKKRAEHQCLIVVDEASIKFNCRDFSNKDRSSWCTFFAHHRHYGYDILLIAQQDRMIDRQIRANIEYEYLHRKVNNFGGVGFALSLLHIPLFISIEKWYTNKIITDKSFFVLNKKTAALYDTFADIDVGGASERGDPLLGL